MQVIAKERARAEVQAAAVVRERLSNQVQERGNAVLALPGGRSVAGVLEQLAETEAPFSEVDVFFVDERCVPLEDEESNFTVVQRSFLEPLAAAKNPVPEDRIHPFHCNGTAKNLGVDAYEREFHRVTERLDVAVLGVGEDGHVASLFPGAPELESAGSSLAEPFLAVENAPKPPAQRMSASPSLLRGASTTILLFFGDGKRTALKNFVAKDGAVSQCPARLVRDNEDLWVFTDIGV
ncbi:MAG: 6-phosphogluconolactonase [Spirochaetota bacterium]